MISRASSPQFTTFISRSKDESDLRQFGKCFHRQAALQLVFTCRRFPKLVANLLRVHSTHAVPTASQHLHGVEPGVAVAQLVVTALENLTDSESTPDRIVLEHVRREQVEPVVLAVGHQRLKDLTKVAVAAQPLDEFLRRRIATAKHNRDGCVSSSSFVIEHRDKPLVGSGVTGVTHGKCGSATNIDLGVAPADELQELLVDFSVGTLPKRADVVATRCSLRLLSRTLPMTAEIASASPRRPIAAAAAPRSS